MTQKTEDSVGRSIEESWLGQNGIYTGRTSANANAYLDRQRSQGVRVSPGAGIGNGAGSSAGNLLAVVAIGLGTWVGIASDSVLTGFLAVAALSAVAGLVALVLRAICSIFRWIFSGGLIRAFSALVKVAIGLLFWVGVILVFSSFSDGT